MRSAFAALFWIGLLESTPAADWYVATNGTGGGTSWADATNSLQGAINASTAGDTVLVSNGVYETGGVTNFPTGTLLTNRVAIYKAITVRSKDNDPTNTIIKGAGPNGSAAVRCVYMTNGSALIGFTLTNGATLTAGTYDRDGGGVWCQSTNPVVSNCLLAKNSSFWVGGGAFQGALYNCTLSGNSSQYGGGARYSYLNNCALIANSAAVYGGGAAQGTLSNCTLTGNSAGDHGGGTRASTLNNCALTTNSAVVYGGGVAYGTLINCMIVSNSAGNNGGGASISTLYNCTVSGNSAGAGGGGGVIGGSLINSIVYFNTATAGGSNWSVVVAFTTTCTAPEATNGTGNITADPRFVDRGAGNYRLNKGSPAINTGTNFSWMTDQADLRSKDLDGARRIDNFSRQVDMGCYELLPSGTMFTFR